MFLKLTTLLALERAKHFVEKGWVQHASALTKRGIDTDPCSRSAVCWCLDGALDRACGLSDNPKISDDAKFNIKEMAALLIDDVVNSRYRNGHYPRYGEYIAFNDASRTTQARVVSVLNAAIKKAEKKKIS